VSAANLVAIAALIFGAVCAVGWHYALNGWRRTLDICDDWARLYDDAQALLWEHERDN
jgi:hypothetical protein